VKFYFFLAVLFFLNSVIIFGQSPVIKVPLKVEAVSKTTATSTGASLDFENKQVVVKVGGQPLKIERSLDKSETFIVTLDKNNPFSIESGEKKTFSQKTKSKSGVEISREFIISSSRNQERKTDNFYIKANYTATGLFQNKRCKIPIGLVDFDTDGDFSNDFNRGSNLGLDQNNDGKFYGKGEWLFSDMIVDLCGKNYLISKIAPDGSYLSLKQTNLQNVKLYQESPKFNFTFVGGKNLSSDILKGKPFLVDFWATWCGICLAKMPEVKQLEGKLPIIYFNTDIIKRKTDALNLIDKLSIKENSTLRFYTSADNFYKSYQRFYPGLPFYVLIDGDGRFRYGGGGGEDLKELKSELTKLGIN
jgi:thiol-disulfide isomerase/thioredoxin